MKKEIKLKLKPCPFCGSKTEFVETTCKHTQTPIIFAKCRHCKIESDWYDTKEKACAAWNHRQVEMTEWTGKVPTEPGYYFINEPYLQVAEIVWNEGCAELDFAVAGNHWCSLKSFVNAYYGKWRRISTPQLPEKTNK